MCMLFSYSKKSQQLYEWNENLYYNEDLDFGLEEIVYVRFCSPFYIKLINIHIKIYYAQDGPSCPEF